MRSSLRGSARPLIFDYDVALLDLDGVVYVGPDAVPGAAEALAAARDQGLRLAFVTNNAARPPHAIAEHLTELGIDAEPNEVVTSAQAAARYLAERLPGGAAVLVVGTTGLYEALRERGLEPVADARGRVDAVVQGYSPEMTWQLLAEGAVAINRGVPWVATNIDPTVPSQRGPLPGNGSLVAALRQATRKEPIVTGKPDPTMHRESLMRTGAQSPIVVGDRLDTDIEGANAVGCPSLLVFTGVTSARDLLDARPAERPTYLGSDVSSLLETHPEPTVDAAGVGCGIWHVAVTDGRLVLRRGAELGDALGSAPTSAASAGGRSVRAEAHPGGHRVDSVAVDAVRALCTAAWQVAPATSAKKAPATSAAKIVVEGADDEASAMVRRLGLAS